MIQTQKIQKQLLDTLNTAAAARLEVEKLLAEQLEAEIHGREFAKDRGKKLAFLKGELATLIQQRGPLEKQLQEAKRLGCDELHTARCAQQDKWFEEAIKIAERMIDLAVQGSDLHRQLLVLAANENSLVERHNYEHKDSLMPRMTIKFASRIWNVIGDVPCFRDMDGQFTERARNNLARMKKVDA